MDGGDAKADGDTGATEIMKHKCTKHKHRTTKQSKGEGEAGDKAGKGNSATEGGSAARRLKKGL